VNPEERDSLDRCAEFLPSVSRTFALTIGVLPRPLRGSVTVAYLLCRLADVLEDSTTGDPEIRIGGLEGLAAALARTGIRAEDLAGALDGLESLPLQDPAAGRLVRERGIVCAAYTGLPQAEREAVSRWVQAMALGMSRFVARERRPVLMTAGSAAAAAEHARLEPGVSFVLETSEELRSYASYVAGTVGYMLTDLFALHLGTGAEAKEKMQELALPFGLGLQFTNILQDLAEDRTRGWSYVPEEIARRHGTTAWRLDAPGERPAALRVVADLVRETAGYLDRAMEYTLLLPRSAPRIRLFCLWPTFFALRTLVRIWGEDQIFQTGEKVRITRGEVRSVMRRTSAACLWNGRLAGLYRQERARLDRQIILRPV
jgi:farnesyl-diphosphate farnesyltransferase